MKLTEIQRSRLAVSTFFFCMGLTFASWASRIPDIKAALGIDDGALGVLLFAIPGGELLIMSFTPRLVNARGSRWACRVYMRFYFAMLVVIGLAANYWSLFMVLAFFGVGSILSNISINTQACALEARYGKSIMSSLHGLWSLGALSGGVIGVAFVALGPPLWVHFLCVALLCAALTAAVSKYLLPKDLQPQKEAENGEPKGWRRVDISLILIGVVAFGGMFCEGTLFDWSSVYFATVVEPPQWLVRAGYVAGIGAMTLGRLTDDRWVRRWGSPRVLRVCGVLIIAGLLLATALPRLWSATVGFMLVGAGISAVVPMCFSAAGHSTRYTPAAAIAMVSAISFFGFLVGPPLIGFLADILGLRASLAIAAAFGLIILTLAGVTRHPGADGNSANSHN